MIDSKITYRLNANVQNICDLYEDYMDLKKSGGSGNSGISGSDLGSIDDQLNTIENKVDMILTLGQEVDDVNALKEKADAVNNEIDNLEMRLENSENAFESYCNELNAFDMEGINKKLKEDLPMKIQSDSMKLMEMKETLDGLDIQENEELTRIDMDIDCLEIRDARLKVRKDVLLEDLKEMISFDPENPKFITDYTTVKPFSTTSSGPVGGPESIFNINEMGLCSLYPATLTLRTPPVVSLENPGDGSLQSELEKIRNTFYFRDLTTKRLLVPGGTVGTVTGFLNNALYETMDAIDGIPYPSDYLLKTNTNGFEEEVQYDKFTIYPLDILNVSNVNRVVGHKRLKESAMASVLTSADFSKLIVDDSVKLAFDMADSKASRQSMVFQTNDRALGTSIINNVSFTILLNRILHRLQTVVLKTLSNSKIVYGYEIPSESGTSVFFNFANQFDTADEALTDVILDVLTVESLETPSRAHMQYMAKKLMSEYTQTSRVFYSREMPLNILIESIRSFGTVGEFAYQYPIQGYQTDSEQLRQSSGSNPIEEFNMKFAYSPEIYIVERARLRNDTKSLEMIPLYLRGKTLFEDSYVQSPVSITGLSASENKTLTMMMAYINNFVPIYLNYRVYLNSITKLVNGMMTRPTNSSINSARDTDTMFTSGVIIGYYDEVPGMTSLKNVFVIQASDGCEEDKEFRTMANVTEDDTRTDDGIYYMTYSDFFKYFAISAWALCSKEWTQCADIFEDFRFDDPEIYDYSSNDLSSDFYIHDIVDRTALFVSEPFLKRSLNNAKEFIKDRHKQTNKRGNKATRFSSRLQFMKQRGINPTILNNAAQAGSGINIRNDNLYYLEIETPALTDTINGFVRVPWPLSQDRSRRSVVVDSDGLYFVSGEVNFTNVSDDFNFAVFIQVANANELGTTDRIGMVSKSKTANSSHCTFSTIIPLRINAFVQIYAYATNPKTGKGIVIEIGKPSNNIQSRLQIVKVSDKAIVITDTDNPDYPNYIPYLLNQAYGTKQVGSQDVNGEKQFFDPNDANQTINKRLYSLSNREITFKKSGLYLATYSMLYWAEKNQDSSRHGWFRITNNDRSGLREIRYSASVAENTIDYMVDGQDYSINTRYATSISGAMLINVDSNGKMDVRGQIRSNVNNVRMGYGGISSNLSFNGTESKTGIMFLPEDGGIISGPGDVHDQQPGVAVCRVGNYVNPSRTGRNNTVNSSVGDVPYISLSLKNSTNISNSSELAINWDTVVANRGIDHDGSVIKIVESGVYCICYDVYFSGNANGVRQTYIKLKGSDKKYATETHNGVPYDTPQLSVRLDGNNNNGVISMYLESDTELELFAYQDSSSTLSIGGADIYNGNINARNNHKETTIQLCKLIEDGGSFNI